MKIFEWIMTNLDNDHLVSIVRETETLDLVDFNHDWTDGYSTCNGSGVVRNHRPLKFFKSFGGYHCI